MLNGKNLKNKINNYITLKFHNIITTPKFLIFRRCSMFFMSFEKTPKIIEVVLKFLSLFKIFKLYVKVKSLKHKVAILENNA